MTLTELIAEIEKPTITFIPIEGTSSTGIIDCTFEVSIVFKDLGSGVPYPPLSYKSDKKYRISNIQDDPSSLYASLIDKVEAWKAKHDVIREKQTIINDDLTAKWGV